MKRIALFIVVVAISFTAQAGLQVSASTLSATEIKNKIVNRTIFLRIPTGGEFPLQYRSNGRVTGDGTKVGLARFFAPKETGRWWLDGNSMCQQWPTWYKGRTFCFTLEETGKPNQLKWNRDDGRSGLARIQ